METVETVNTVKDLKVCEMGKLRKTKDLLYRGYVIQNMSAVPYQGTGWGDSKEVGMSFYKND